MKRRRLNRVRSAVYLFPLILERGFLNLLIEQVRNLTLSRIKIQGDSCCSRIHRPFVVVPHHGEGGFRLEEKLGWMHGKNTTTAKESPSLDRAWAIQRDSSAKDGNQCCYEWNHYQNRRSRKKYAVFVVHVKDEPRNLEIWKSARSSEQGYHDERDSQQQQDEAYQIECPIWRVGYVAHGHSNRSESYKLYSRAGVAFWIDQASRYSFLSDIDNRTCVVVALPKDRWKHWPDSWQILTRENKIGIGFIQLYCLWILTKLERERNWSRKEWLSHPHERLRRIYPRQTNL
jgi:hypothetical protein